MSDESGCSRIRNAFKGVNKEELLRQRTLCLQSITTDDLFCDVYYQCTHLVGKDAVEGFKKDVLLSYLKNVFEFDDMKCKILIDGMKSKQVPRMVLKVDVVEAKELTPKDANGLSDPYCTLWISSSQTHRFTTSVKKETLQPIWEENFKLPVTSPTQDVLHFEVWDFDAAESLKEKVTKISDVKGFRGIKKFVKEFAQTVASGNHDNELIGSAQITLKNIPANGQVAWFKLQKRGKGASKGMILLKMMFGSEKDEYVALEEHRYLVKTLLQHQIKQEEFDLATWDGVFSPEGEMILRQHLAQCNLGATDDLIAKWVEYVNVHQNKQMNFGILANILSMLMQSMKNELLTEDEVKHFWNAARKVLPSCYNNIRKIRKSAPNDKAILAQLDAILSIIQDLARCSIPAEFNLFPAESYGWVATIDDTLTVKSVLHEAVVHGACDWFEYLISHNRPENNTDEAKLKYLVKVTQLISLDLDGAKKFHEMLFKERLNFPYAKTLFAVYQSNVAELVEQIVTDMCMMMKPLDFEKRDDKDANNDPLAMGTTMFELFLSLQGIERIGAELFQNDDAFETFPLRKFYAWFFPGVVRWLDIAAYKALQRIDKAVELDDFVPVDETVQYSSSAIDTMGIFQQVKTFWDQLAWPDIEGSYTFMAKIIDDICKSSIHYADRVAAKVDSMGETQTAYEKKFEVTAEWCVAINNIDYIHHSIHPFVKGLGLDKLLNSLSDFKSTTAAEHCRQTLELVMANAVENVGHKISELSETLAKKMEPAMTRFLQEGAELLHQQCNVIDRLMSYLDENLTTLNSKLNTDNFNRTLDVIWERISNILFALVQNGIEKRRPPSYFHNLQETLHILIGFFKIDEKLSQEENKKLNDILAKVERILTIYGMETPELIHQYYVERLGEQDGLEKSEDGMMTVQLQIDQDKLIIDVLNASNLRSMDSNGQSDPFVSIRLIPKHKFPTHKYKTKVHKKTLFPLFEEKFTITLANDQDKIKDALVMFVMKDQDLFGATNDYMAEAFVPLNDVDKVEPNKYPKMRNLKLNRPKNTESDILKALDYRTGDKLARDFVKKQKSRMEVPH